MRLKNSIKFYVVICMMLAGICFGKGQVANGAESAIVSLTPDVVYQYDVTEDGAADAVKVEIVDNKDEEASGTIKILVNDKLVFEQKRKQEPYWNVKLIKLQNGKVFFDISSTIMSDDDCIHRLYICEKDKLKSVYDFQKYYNKYADYYFADIVDVSANTIKIEVRAQFYVTGSIQFDMKVNYKDGKFTRTSDTFAPKYKAMSRKNKWTAKRKIKVYKKVGSKKVAYTLKKKEVVKLNKIIYKDNKVYFQVKNDKGKIGYIAPSKTNTSINYFKEAQYAG